MSKLSILDGICQGFCTAAVIMAASLFCIHPIREICSQI